MATEGQTMGKCVAFNCPICLEQIIKPNFFLGHKHSAGHVCRSTFLDTLLEKKIIALISNARSVGEWRDVLSREGYLRGGMG